MRINWNRVKCFFAGHGKTGATAKIHGWPVAHRLWCPNCGKTLARRISARATQGQIDFVDQVKR